VLQKLSDSDGENEHHFLSRVLPGGGTGENLIWSGSFLKGWADNLLLVSAIPGALMASQPSYTLGKQRGKNAVLRLYNGKSEKPIGFDSD
jgi:hypothetical protein